MAANAPGIIFFYCTVLFLTCLFSCDLASYPVKIGDKLRVLLCYIEFVKENLVKCVLLLYKDHVVLMLAIVLLILLQASL